MTPSPNMVVERDAVSLHVEVHGAPGEHMPLFLTHGYGSSSAMWRPNIEALAATRQVITWDVRGHGRTVTPPVLSRFTHEAALSDMEAVLERCGLATAAVGGLSLGGYLSLAFFAAHRSRVEALLLFDTGPGFKRDDARNRWNTYASSREDFFEREGLAALEDSPEVSLAEHDPVGLALAARGLLTQSDDSVISMLETIDVPSLIVVGADDQPFRAAADYMAAKIPGAVEVVIADAGHASNVDQPAEFDRAVLAFLEELEARPVLT